MKVTVEQSGGFVGFLRKSIDSQELTPAEEQTLRELVEQGLPASATQSAQGAGNAPKYAITVENGGAKRELYLSESAKNEQTARLIQFVQQKGKPLPPPR